MKNLTNSCKMDENDATNGHTEAATDLEKKIIKQIEVSYNNYITF